MGPYAIPPAVSIFRSSTIMTTCIVGKVARLRRNKMYEGGSELMGLTKARYG